MKNRLKTTIIFTIFLMSAIFSFYAVQAYSGETDPNDYIKLPDTIYIEKRCWNWNSNFIFRSSWIQNVLSKS